MRKKFATDLYELMKKDSSIVLITADLGYGMFDKIREKFPKQFFNVGAAEQVAVDIAVGMALSGKIPIVYTITPFFFRAWEGIRNYIDHENIPVILVASGRDGDYKTEGFSHFGGDDNMFLMFKNIVFIKHEINYSLRDIIYSRKPVYLNLKR